MIPLGVDCDAFKRDPALGVAYRQELGIGAEDIAIILVARLSNSTKFSPLPMYLALQRAAERRGRKLHLLLAGWIEGDGSRAAFTEGAKRACPDVQVHFVDGQNAEIRAKAWAAADIFTLPVDNVQETFGLAPVEAMAAGLPVVASDFDGYRELVVDGATGVLVPTLGTRAPDVFEDLLGILDPSLSQFVMAQTVAVDVEALADRLGALVDSRELRERLGSAGRETVLLCLEAHKRGARIDVAASRHVL
jgi:glycosyltransferase involved in cell wall biosynthesis